QIMAETGRALLAVDLNRQALALMNQSSDDVWLRAAATWLRATIAAQADQDLDLFETLLRQAIVEFGQAGDAFMSAISLNIVAELRGDPSGARAHHQASLEQARLISDPRATALAVEGLAAAAAGAADGSLAARLMGHAEQVRTDQRAARAPSECDDVERARA